MALRDCPISPLVSLGSRPPLYDSLCVNWADVVGSRSVVKERSVTTWIAGLREWQALR